ncbi:unnamed protein product [Moneuplotes crassus]|uniref:THH1/TOM1/TOM3 domain-containing protein n=1 Tax=Euplotes crassus TaxID=5936 RepID=A0AAD2CZK8_EUPCR|nr:unnamed protein product [Moneuplotes crassus]
MTLVQKLDRGESGHCLFYMIFLGFTLFLSVIAMIFTGFWTIKFIKIFKARRKLQLLFLLLVDASTVGRVAYFIVEIVWRADSCDKSPSICIEVSLYWLSSTLFSAAIVVNIFSWINQTLRIRKFHYGIRSNKTFFYIAFFIFLALISLIYLGFIISACLSTKEEHTMFKVFKIIYGTSFIVLGVFFIIVGAIFYCQLKKIFKTKAKAMKCQIIFSIISISSSFILRSILTFAMFSFYIYARYRERWLRENTIWFPLILALYFIVSEILPTFYLCMSVKMVEKKIIEKEIQEKSNHKLGLTDDRSMRLRVNESMLSRFTLETTGEKQ